MLCCCRILYSYSCKNLTAVKERTSAANDTNCVCVQQDQIQHAELMSIIQWLFV